MTVNPEAHRVRPEQGFDLSLLSTSDTQGLEMSKAEAREHLKGLNREAAELQERLYAESEQSLLLVLQAMDTGGKDSTLRSVLTGINPQGVWVRNFKKPSANELARDYLWRIHRDTPPRGRIGVYNRSHYEDVLIVKVHGWVPPEVIARRYREIREYERMLSDNGTRIIKVMLNISKEYQLERLRRRLRRPDKHWKFNPSDLKERAHWDAYMEAYQRALQECSTEQCPWYVVPAETRWYRNLVVAQLLVNALKAMNPTFPPPEFDPNDYPPESLV
ncbi:MAG: hypothetical protein JJ976_11395 [Rhodothermales bacterium]|nr:hypothetical protein [Rhodothermales bacterium]